jgi:hypothetical protein
VGLALLVGGEPPATSVLLMSGGLTLGLSARGSVRPVGGQGRADGPPRAPHPPPGPAVHGGDVRRSRWWTSAISRTSRMGMVTTWAGRSSGWRRPAWPALPGGGRAYRCGGDEFAVVFPGSDEGGGPAVISGVFQRSLEESPFVLRRWPRPGGSVGDKTSRDPEADPPAEAGFREGEHRRGGLH